MKALTAFLPDLAVDTLGAPQIMQVQALRNAAIEFCARTRCWLDVQEYPLAAPKYEYEFALEAGQIVHEIREGYLNEAGYAPAVKPRAPSWLDERYPGWQQGLRAGKPSNVTSLDPATFIVVPAPSTSYVLTLTLALKPARDATLVPDLLFNDHYDAIVAGAKARLMAIPNQAWTNAQLAIAYGTQFDGLATQAQRRAEKGFGRGHHRVRGHYV